ncbi:uncharacterized protein DSM5745_09746 [Aspergillus mulundensis]|uniref:J domain-containing protein n=1 Tax=Aspergillus mulundensis TaxID=1810919 RepID=A0A3D8QRB3_9EURO|nr:hypothetical protein DSM5745_09746 [Aspergillus mulundensis]RDW64335.1 hypothetical protein DSM5745_09746 [Aspergillus mulundensis]
MPLRPHRDYYAVLGVQPTADSGTIKAAYRKLALTKHPDRNKDANATAEFQLISEAYETLVDETKRRTYDSSICSQHTSASAYARPPTPTPAYAPPTPASSEQPPIETWIKKEIASLKATEQRAHNQQLSAQRTLDEAREKLVRTHEELTKILEEQERITREKAADERWVVTFTASLLRHRGDIARRQKRRGVEIAALDERLGEKNGEFQDLLLEIRALEQRVFVTRAMREKTISQMRRLQSGVVFEFERVRGWAWT